MCVVKYGWKCIPNCTADHTANSAWKSFPHRWKLCWFSDAKHLRQVFLIRTQDELPQRHSCVRWAWTWILLSLISSVVTLWQMPNVSSETRTQLRHNLFQGVKCNPSQMDLDTIWVLLDKTCGVYTRFQILVAQTQLRYHIKLSLFSSEGKGLQFILSDIWDVVARVALLYSVTHHPLPLDSCSHRPSW